ncbi:hypothetical protein NKG05_06880 [Oerskovia sp. M15]
MSPGADPCVAAEGGPDPSGRADRGVRTGPLPRRVSSWRTTLVERRASATRSARSGAARRAGATAGGPQA